MFIRFLWFSGFPDKPDDKHENAEEGGTIWREEIGKKERHLIFYLQMCRPSQIV